jgi:hypothetical protein
MERIFDVFKLHQTSATPTSATALFLAGMWYEILQLVSVYAFTESLDYKVSYVSLAVLW